MPRYHSYDPAVGHGLPHDPFKAIVAPRPIGWISSVNAEGRANLAPYSFFNAFSSHPPIIGFCSEGAKHSVVNIRATGVFCYNLAGFGLLEAMNRTSVPYPDDVDEFEAAGLDKAMGEAVAVPRVALSPASLECRMTEIHQLRDVEGRPIENYLVLGQVVRVHIDVAMLENGKFEITRAETLARCGYRGDYVAVRETFEALRPTLK